MRVVEIGENLSIDYDIIADRELFEMFQTFNRDNLADAATELAVLSEAFYTKNLTLSGVLLPETIMEADGVSMPAAHKQPEERRTTGLISNVKEFIRKIIVFIQDMLQKFLQAVNDIIQSDTSWLNENERLLRNIPPDVLSDMKISCVPYFLSKAHGRLRVPDISVKPNTSGFFRGLLNVLQGTGVYKKDRVYQDYFSELYKINPNNIREASMIFYKGGMREVKTFTGRDCLDVIDRMINFCRNYKTYADACKRSMNNIQNSIREQERYINELKRARAEITNTSTRESFMFGDSFYSILEDSNIFMTEISDLNITLESNIDMLLEDIGAGVAVANNQNNPNVVSKNAKIKTDPNSSPNRVRVSNQNTPNNNQTENQGNANIGNTRSVNAVQKGQAVMNDIKQVKVNTLLSAYQMATTVATSKLTVCETVHHSYMKVLRGIADGMRKYNTNTQRDKENRAYNYYEDHKEEIQRRKEMEGVRHRKARARVDAGVLKRLKGILW